MLASAQNMQSADFGNLNTIDLGLVEEDVEENEMEFGDPFEHSIHQPN